MGNKISQNGNKFIVEEAKMENETISSNSFFTLSSQTPPLDPAIEQKLNNPKAHFCNDINMQVYKAGMKR